MNIALAYSSCALAAIVILWQCRTVRHLITSATRLQAVFPRRIANSDGAAGRVLPMPLALPLGSPVPNFRARRIDGSAGDVDRTNLVGETNMVVFCRARELEEWDPNALVAVLGGCWMKVDGKVHVFLPASERLDMANVTVRALLESTFAEDLVFAAGETSDLWEAFGVRSTPCVVELDRGGVVRKYGVMRETSGRQTAGAGIG